jgi:hypothetical protein
MYVAYGAWPLFGILVIWSILVFVLAGRNGRAAMNEAS